MVYNDFGNLDNEGTGFDLGDNDLESLLEEAIQHEEPNDEGDTSIYFKDIQNSDGEYAEKPNIRVEPNEAAPKHDEPTQKTEVIQPSEAKTEPELQNNAVEEEEFDINEILNDSTGEESFTETFEKQETKPEIVQNEPITSNTQVNEYQNKTDQTEKQQTFETQQHDSWLDMADADDSNISIQTTDQQTEEPQTTATPTTIETEPVQVAHETVITNEYSKHAEINIETITRIVKITELFNNLNEKEKSLVSQFITGGTPVHETPELVYRVLNVDPTLSQSMTSLKEIKESDPIDRVLMIIELDKNLLSGLASLVSVITETNIDLNASKKVYIKALFKNIDKIDNESMSIINATEALLSA